MPAFQAGDAGSIPATRTKYALVAQWIEQETSKLLVVGSIPTQGTKLIRYTVYMQRLDHLRKKVELLYTSKDSNPNTWDGWAYKNHVLVVADYAEELAQSNNANVELVVAGALLHDIADAVMDRHTPGHETESLKMAREILMNSGYNESEIIMIIDEIIKPHSCNEIMPKILEGKVLAAADGAAHFTTDFYLFFCWQHYGPAEDYQKFKDWVLKKIEKDFTKKMFFADVKNDIRPQYEALKLIFSL